MAVLAPFPVSAHCGRCVDDCKKIAAQMEEGKTALASAIAAAEAQSKGRAVAAMGKLAKGKASTDVRCFVGEKLMEMNVDAAGKASEAKDAKDSFPKADVLPAIDASKLTLDKIIHAGEEKSKGKALAVLTKAEDGKITFHVYCLVEPKIQKVTVDAAGKAAGMEEVKTLPNGFEVKPKASPAG